MLLEEQDLVRALAPHLTSTSLLALLCCCKDLRAVEGIEVDLGTWNAHASKVPASRALEFATRSASRFIVVGCEVSTLGKWHSLLCSSDVHSMADVSQVHHCDQQAFDALLGALPALRSLSVRAPSSLCSLEAAPRAQALRVLKLAHRVAENVSTLEPLGGCRALEHLAFHGGATSTSSGVAALHQCPRLRTLDLRRCGCGAIEGLHMLSSDSSAVAWTLDSLGLQACTKPLIASDLAPLAAFRSLRELDLSLNTALRSVALLGQCTKLRTLTLTGCTALDDVSGLSLCPMLSVLYLTGCTALVDVLPLVDCPALRTLSLNRCSRVVNVGELGHIKTLELLNLRCSGAVLVPYRSGLRVQWDTTDAGSHGRGRTGTVGVL